MRGLWTRLAHLIFVLFGVTLFVFFLLNFLPSDPAEIIAGASGNTATESVDEIRKNLGLDRPVIERYVDWLGNVAHGDLGKSYRTNQPVLEAIKQPLPVTLELVLLTEILSLVIAVPLAVICAYRRDGRFDKATTITTFGLQSIPSFVTSLLLIYIFAVGLGWLPAIGYTRLSDGVVENLRTLAIPAMALSSALVPVYFRVLRNEMVRTLQEDYILMARAEGIPPRVILFRYALRSSMPTLVTVVGINIGSLVGGTLIVELISGVPGMGRLLFEAISNRDYLMVQGVILVIASAYVLANFIVDVSYPLMDPRVRR